MVDFNNVAIGCFGVIAHRLAYRLPIDKGEELVYPIHSIRFPRPSMASVSFLVLSLLFAVGCQSATTRAHRALESGKVYMKSGKYAEASIEFQRALKRDPNLVEAQYYFAKSELKLGRWSDAYKSLKAVVEQQPSFIAARLDLAELLAAAAKPSDAEAQLDAVQALEPKNARAQSLRAAVYIVKQDVSGAIQECEKAKALAPKEAIIWTECGFAKASLKQYRSAESDFRQAITLDPAAPENYRNLANALRLQGRSSEIEPLLSRAVQEHPKSLDFSLLLADFYVTEGRSSDAEQLFKQLKARRSEFPDLEENLADFWTWRNQVTRAVGELEEVERSNPRIVIEKKLVNAYITLGRVDEAYQYNKNILKVNAHDLEGRTFDGAIAYLRGDYRESTEKLQAVLKEEPDSLLANFYLGQSWAALNEPERAKSAFNDCIRINSGFLHAYVQMARLAAGAKDWKTAIEYARKAIQLDPSFLDAYYVLGQTQLLKGDPVEAEQTLKAIQSASVNSAQLHELLAESAAVRGNLSEAQREAKEAIRTSGQPFVTLTRIANFEADHGLSAAAIDLTNEWLASVSPQSSYYDFLCELYVHQHDLKHAEAQARRAIELDAKDWQAHLLLGSVFQQNTKYGDAANEYEHASRLNPKQTLSLVLASNLLIDQGEYDKSKVYLDTALQRDPTSLPVQTALARWYSDQGKQLDVALTMAQEIKKTLPDDPSVSDILGWTYYHKRAFTLALQQLEVSAAAMPDNALIQYHLGMTYMQLGQKDKSEKALRRALKLGLPSASAVGTVQENLKLMTG